MERETKKREREDDKNETETNAKKQEHISSEDSDTFKVSDPFLPLGVFEFPWLKENVAWETEDWKLDDVFSRSLLDTSSTTEIDFCGDCLCQTETPVVTGLPVDKSGEEPWPWGEIEIDGFDCIWSPVLNQPLPADTFSFSKVSSADNWVRLSLAQQ